ncbi:S1 family peptidase [Mycolicibacterium porcinum]|uniref:S1 family peptidase n=1 Tax=Mycolicibacterium porcinum TaxID=39693 RepID=UPI0010424009|nr:serine protease [Mycolicibacterium porcinum]
MPEGIEPPNVGIPIPEDSFRTLFMEMVFSPKGADTDVDDSPTTVLATGTGFFYRVDGETFIMTARHNVTGRHPETNEFLSKAHSVEPTHLRVRVRRAPTGRGYSTAPGSARFQVPFREYLIPLIDDAWKPIWLEHPEYGPKMDVVAVPYKNPHHDEMLVLPWDEQQSADLTKLWVTQDVSIVGYPFGLESGPSLPLWIRGTIASEPVLQYRHADQYLPLFLVDARTRSGQSGSPVLLFQLPGSPLPPENGQFRYALGTYSRLLGVYTGRISDESDLGFVWHMSEAAKICTRGSESTEAPVQQQPRPVT